MILGRGDTGTELRSGAIVSVLSRTVSLAAFGVVVVVIVPTPL